MLFLTDSRWTLGRSIHMEQWSPRTCSYSVCCWKWSCQHRLCSICSVYLHTSLPAGCMYCVCV